MKWISAAIASLLFLIVAIGLAVHACRLIHNGHGLFGIAMAMITMAACAACHDELRNIAIRMRLLKQKRQLIPKTSFAK